MNIRYLTELQGKTTGQDPCSCNANLSHPNTLVICLMIKLAVISTHDINDMIYRLKLRQLL